MSLVAGAPVGSYEGVGESEPARLPDGLDVAVAEVTDPTPVAILRRPLTGEGVGVPVRRTADHRGGVLEEAEHPPPELVHELDRPGPALVPAAQAWCGRVPVPGREEEGGGVVAPIGEVGLWPGERGVAEEFGQRLLVPGGRRQLMPQEARAEAQARGRRGRRASRGLACVGADPPDASA